MRATATRCAELTMTHNAPSPGTSADQGCYRIIIIDSGMMVMSDGGGGAGCWVQRELGRFVYTSSSHQQHVVQESLRIFTSLHYHTHQLLNHHLTVSVILRD